MSDAVSFKIEDMFSVQGQIVLVTGGGTGLGKAITSGFAVNGAKVYITGRRMEVLEAAAKEINGIARQGGQVIPIRGDVATKDAVKKIVAQLEAKEKVVDVLINCAGVSLAWKTPIADPKDNNDPVKVMKMLMDVDDEDFDYTNRINVNGVFFLTTFMLPLLRKSSNPSVVIISSVASMAMQRLFGTLTYGVSKGAVNRLSELLAARLHPMKIRVNTVCPGIFPSEMTGTTSGSYTYDLNPAASIAVKRATMGRPGKPEEIVAPILMLSSKGGMYMDNARLLVDGGRLMGAAGLNDGIPMDEE